MSTTMATLVRHHDAYRYLGKWTLVTLLLATAWLGAITRLAGDGGGGGAVDPWLLLTTMWVGPALHLVAGPGDRRCRDLLLTLPLSGRRLWLAHVLATGVAAAMVLAITLGVSWAGLAWLGRIGLADGGGIGALRDKLGPVALQISSWWVLLLVALQTYRPGLAQVSRGRGYTVATGAAVIVGGMAVANLGRLGPATAAVPVVLAAGLGVLAWRRVPPVLSVAPREAQAAGRVRAASSPVGPSRPAPLLLPLTILRATAKNQALPIVAYPLLVGLGFMLGDNASAFTAAENDSFLLVAITAYAVFAITAAALPRFWLFDHLPISRARILAILLAPQVLCLAAGFGGGRIVVLTRTPSAVEPIAFGSGVQDYGLRVLPRFFAVAWDGRPAAVVAPSGESCVPLPQRVIAGLPLALYKPFETPAGCSLDFVAWQLERAMAAAFGQAIPAAELRQRYLTTDEGGRVVLQSNALTLMKDHPSWRLKPARGVLALQILLVGLLAFAGLAAYARCLRADVRPGVRRAAFGVILAVLMVLHLGPYFQAALLHIEPELGAAFLVILSGRIAGALPGGVVTFWVLAVAALGFAARGTACVMTRVELAVRAERD
jgi:hypothetical protein